MKREFFTEARVGIFVMAGLLLTMIVLFQLGGQNEMFQRQYTLYASFKDISGLRAGASVQLGGLSVGNVDEIRFPEELLEKQLTVKLRINKHFQERIRLDSVAMVNTQGLLGDKYIYISVGSEDQPVIPANAFVPTKETTSIFALADKAGAIMDNIGEAAQTVNDLLKTFEGEKEGDLKASIKSIRRTLEQVEKGQGTLHTLIYDQKGAEELKNMLSSMKTASADLKEILGSVRRGEGTLGMLIRDPGLYNDLRTLLGRANRNVLMKAVVRATLRENEGEVLKSE